jgi:hypothetical protein
MPMCGWIKSLIQLSTHVTRQPHVFFATGHAAAPGTVRILLIARNGRVEQ